MMMRRVDCHSAVRGTVKDGSRLEIIKILRNSSERRHNEHEKGNADTDK